jgi:glycerol-3-phosphate acyltransferase PlsX
MSVTLAVDAMGGDFGVAVTIPACCDFLQSHPDVMVIAVGDPKLLNEAIKRCNAEMLNRFQIIGASEIVLMDDPIEVALRRKKDSSMRVAIEQVQQGKADAVVSAGNTGALMAISRYILKTLEGIDRPAIATAIPNELGKGTTVLDLGANADCEPIHLLQFAQMADVMLRVVNGNTSPTIGLLNIGEEVIKGNDVVKQAAELLRQSKLNFYGNVEGNDIFKGTTDIVVCDGFVGNVVLKASEGLAKMMRSISLTSQEAACKAACAALTARSLVNSCSAAKCLAEIPLRVWIHSSLVSKPSFARRATRS